MKIAIVILNWNGKNLLQKFLPSVVRYSPTEWATIYLADNASTDDSVSFVKENFSTVKIIQNTENGGYAKGYNDALKLIDAEVYCLLNSDIEVTENWLEPIYTHFLTNATTAIIQPKILDYKKKTHFEYAGAAGGFVDKLGYPYCRGRIFNALEQDNAQYDDEFPVFWASGACLFIRSHIFWKLGALDEMYFAHQEEIDLCWRAFNENYKTIYIGKSTVYHVGGASLSHSHWKKTFLNFRNSLFNLIKNASGNVVWLVFQRLIMDGMAGVKFLMEGKAMHTWAIVKAHFSFYKHVPTLVRKRKKTELKKKDYYKIKNIVWQHFIKHKKLFKEL